MLIAYSVVHYYYLQLTASGQRIFIYINCILDKIYLHLILKYNNISFLEMIQFQQ